jgi:hypothetical protein
MIELHEQLGKALGSIYDMEFIDLDKFYNSSENLELLKVLSNVLIDGIFDQKQLKDLKDLEKNLDSFLAFETNHNCCVGDFY